jgi:hypothetical protein
VAVGLLREKRGRRPAGLRAEKRKKRRRWAGDKGVGWAGMREGEGERFGVFLFFLNLFKLLKIKLFSNLKTTNLFQNFQNILTTFKTSHQNMMLKHLLLLNY